MTFPRLSLIAGLLSLALAGSGAVARDWHRVDGKPLCEGKLLSVENGQVTILSEDGIKVIVPIDKLSLEDAGFVEQTLHERDILLGKAPQVAATVVKPDKGRNQARPRKELQAEKDAADSGKIDFPLTDPNTTTWQARPDPSKWTWDKAVDPTLVAKLPEADISQGLLLPDCPSPYVAIANARDEFKVWDRWNLRTGQRDGVVRGAPRENGLPAMSPDGKLLAVLPLHNSDAIQVWRFDTGKFISRIDPDMNGYATNTLSFVAETGLLLHSSARRQTVYDAMTGKERAVLPNVYFDSNIRLALSPGRHYLAIAQERSGRLGLVDTRNGAVAGDLLIPETNRDFNQCTAIGFSAAGDRIWLVLGRHSDYRLIGWNLANGEVVVNEKLNELASARVDDSGAAEKLPDIQEIPEVGGLLLHGRLLVDPKTGEVMWEYGNVGNTKLPPILRLLGKSQMLIRRGSFTGTRLTVVPIPLDEIKTSRDIIRAGGTTRDMRLPPLSKAEWSKVERRRVIANSDEKYSATRSAAAKVPAQISIDLAGNAKSRASVQSIRFVGGSSSLCGVLSSSQNESRIKEQTSKIHLAVYDLAAAKSIAELNLTAAVSLLDISADGGQAVVGTTDDGRIDVWDLRAKKHQLGFRPNGLTRSRVSPYQTSSSSFPFARIVARQRLLTHELSGELVLWETDGARAVYSIKVRAGSAVALDDSRKYVVVHDDQGVRVCAVESGKAVVTLPAIQMPSEATMTAAVFRSDGKQVAILFDTSTSSQLIMWNLASNKAECEMRLPFTARAIAWSGADLLLGSLYSRNSAWFYRGYHPMQRSPSSANYERQYPDPNQLWPPEKLRTVVRVSPSEQRLVWLYSVTEPPGFAGQPMTNYPANLDIVGQTAIDRAWLSLKARTAEQDLVSIGDRTSEEAKAIQQHEMPQINEVKGNEISVVVDVHELPETVVRAAARRAEFQSSLEKSLRKLLADYTLKTAAEKPLMFKATVKEVAARDLRAPDGKATLFGKPGTSMSYTVSPNGPNGLGVLARLELRTKTENKERDEEPLWLGEAWFAADTRITANSDVQSELQLLVPWEKAVRWLGERTLPSRSLDSSQFSVAGATELTLRDAAVEVKDGPHE